MFKQLIGSKKTGDQVTERKMEVKLGEYSEGCMSCSVFC